MILNKGYIAGKPFTYSLHGGVISGLQPLCLTYDVPAGQVIEWRENGNAEYLIDWDDGEMEQHTTTIKSAFTVTEAQVRRAVHTYTAAGTYQVKIYALTPEVGHSALCFGSTQRWGVSDSTTAARGAECLVGAGGTYRFPTAMPSATTYGTFSPVSIFADCVNLRGDITILADRSSVLMNSLNMLSVYMFYGCTHPELGKITMFDNVLSKTGSHERAVMQMGGTYYNCSCTEAYFAQNAAGGTNSYGILSYLQGQYRRTYYGTTRMRKAPRDFLRYTTGLTGLACYDGTCWQTFYNCGDPNGLEGSFELFPKLTTIGSRRDYWDGRCSVFSQTFEGSKATAITVGNWWDTLEIRIAPTASSTIGSRLFYNAKNLKDIKKPDGSSAEYLYPNTVLANSTPIPCVLYGNGGVNHQLSKQKLRNQVANRAKTPEQIYTAPYAYNEAVPAKPAVDLLRVFEDYTAADIAAMWNGNTYAFLANGFLSGRPIIGDFTQGKLKEIFVDYTPPRDTNCFGAVNSTRTTGFAAVQTNWK